MLLGGPLTANSEQVLDPENAFEPPWQQTIMMVGQDRPTIDAYVKSIGIVPAGVMVYTSIQKLTGLTSAFNDGSGIHHAEYLLKKYPDSVLQLGLYMVDALLQINSGAYDANIDQLAEWIASVRRPVYLRIGYEFDEPNNNYDTTQYIYAYQRIVDRIRAKKVPNVVFVWHSSGQLIEDDPTMWYPGDDYVDWIGVSYFSTSQYERAMTMYWMAFYKDKPFMIAEASPFGMVTVRAKKDWYKKFFQLIDETKAHAVCYINTHWDALPTYKDSRYGDARVQQYPEIKQMWLEELKKDQYIHAEHLKTDESNPHELSVPTYSNN